MPLARSNTSRSKSRSPAPDFKRLTSPRPFLPPSHYAAAAGIPYNARSTARSDSGSSSDLDASLASKDSLEDQPYNSFMPISYPAELESASDSSFEFKASGSRRGDKSSSRRSSVRSKRQSHITGLPLLEAQLLPSLRDTIDRMTRSPASATSTSSAGATRLEMPIHLNGGRSTRSSSFSSDHLGSLKSHLDPSATPTSSSSSFAYTPTTSEPISSNLHSSSTVDVDSLTRSKLPPKSALKSALRPPTPRLFSAPSPVVEASTNPQAGGVSLKSVRNILCRKLSSGSLSLSPISSRKPTVKSSESDMPSSSRHMRKRSCTDPGSLPPEASSPSKDSSTPVIRQPPFRTPKSEGTQSNSSGHKSGIPRPQVRSPWSSRSAHTEDSDVEYRYEADGRERRRLVVANAEVFPSSSESDVDNREVLKAKDINLNETGSWGLAESNVGLGFNFGAAVSKARGRRDSGNQHQQEARRTEHGDPAWNSRTPRLPARGMRLTGNRPDYGDGHARGNTRDSSADLDEEHQRRRAALLGIVSRLELGSSALVAGESEESEYGGEEGFAISGSGEFADRISQHEKPDGVNEDGSAYGDGDDGSPNPTHINNWQDEERTRISSCMPTFLLSTEDSDDGQGSDAYLPHPTLHKSASSRSSSPQSHHGLRASSRSPIIRNVNSNIPMPAALQRHSVYHRSPSPRLYLDTKENTTRHSTSPSPRFNQAEWHSATGPAHTQARVCTPRYDRDSEQSDAVLIAERSHAAAARERRAFGIPPSESVEVYQQRASQLLSHSESNLSSVGSVYWQEGEGELSPAAETLFRRLSGKEIGRRNQSQQNNAENIQPFGLVSLSPSASSIYDNRHENGDQHNQIAQAVQERDDRHGDGSRSARSVEAVHADGEDLEAKRQELIRELCQTEEIFVKRLHVFVRFFVLPLRVQNSKTWISGVPSEVARLFDWFEDIMNLHTQMLSLLQATRTAQYPIVERVAESIRAFIARFEVYQPYLVRVADVVSLMERLVQDETSDFGEFVDIQQSAPECDDWSFQMFLNEPLGRLAKYPDFFSRLLRLTPKTHPDYLSTFSLVHSTDLIIHVLNEVNVREKEYDLIKSISVRIQELPPSVQLATRERRLLFRGLLHLVNTDEAVNKSKIALTTSAICSENSKGRSTNLANLSSKLAIEINEWDTRRARSESTSSSSTGTSFNSLGTSSGACSDMPAAPCSTFFSSYRIPIPDGRLNSTTNKTPASPSPNPRRSSTPRGTPVQVLIFTDLMVLTAPTSSLAPATTGDWTLLKNIGITRILGVPERLEQEPYDPLIVLDVLPVDVSKLNRGVSTDNGSLTVLRFVVPDEQVPTLSEKAQAPVIKEDVRRAWISAFQQCFRYTLHSISLPLHPRYDPHLDLAIDTHQTVFSLLASGLPLPKSPSIQDADVQRGEANDSTKQEREERGWWSVRFQQVFRELQRQDMALLSVTMAS